MRAARLRKVCRQRVQPFAPASVGLLRPCKLAETLAAITPYENDSDFMKQIYEQQSPVGGLPPERVASDMRELKDLGYLELFQYQGKIDSFRLLAAGRDYRRNRIGEVAKTVLRYAFQLLVGASGGLVVLLLGRLLA